MTDLNRHRIFWHSRRGMLELDLLLVPFATEVFASLSPDEQQLYEDFLASEDQDLYHWLLLLDEPPDSRFKPLIAKILAHSAAGTWT